MSYCPKCGGKIREDMAFCPKCGAPLKSEQPPAQPAPVQLSSRKEKAEKHEKHEKEEKGEKTEKHEKHEYGFVGWFIGGVFLILLGLMTYLQVSGYFPRELTGALFLIVIGVIIIGVALYVLMVVPRRHPKT